MARDDPEFEQRLCRLNGKKPTARDIWRAFHRLWRIARGHGPFHDMEADLCFRVLFRNWGFIRLMDGPESDGYVNNSRIPKFLRERMLRDRKRRRLYGDHPEWRERDKQVARHVRERHGMEVTPEEVAETRRKVIELARAKAAEMDIKLPKDDEALLRLLKPEDKE